MKYILLKDFDFIKAKFIKYLIAYIIIMLIIMFGLHLYSIEVDEILNCLGLIVRKGNYLDFTRFAFVNMFYLFAAIVVFSNNIGTKMYNLVSRMKLSNIVISKLISTQIMTTIIFIINNLIVCFFAFFYKIDYFSINIVLINYLFVSSISLYFISLYINKYNLLSIFGLIFILLNCSFNILNINLLYLVLWICFSLLVNFFCIKKSRILLLEK